MSVDEALLADPQRYAEHVLPPRSDHRWFASRAEAESGVSSFERSLGGSWKFHFAPDLASRPDGFEQSAFDVSSWDDIPVPAHLQLQGYGWPHYTNVAYPWDGTADIWPGELPERNPVGSYVTWFDAPQLAERERLVIRFDGVESAFGVWLNGQWVGYSTDSFTPAEFDLTAVLAESSNRLAVQVVQFSSGSWLEDQDFFRFSGIFRGVTLLHVPAVHVADLAVSTTVEPGLATVKLDVRLEGEGEVRAFLDGVGELDGVIQVPNPRLWSAEDPQLYDLWLEVVTGGEVVEVIRQRVGLRRFGIEDGLLRINGQRVVFNGVNRHEFGPRGRVMTAEEIAVDLRLLKAHNVNAVRTSHYPNSSVFYDLCDELGLYVIDEMNLETHGMWDAVRLGRIPLEEMVPGDRPEWLGACKFRAANMLLRDRNHPCIVMWSCGNESLGGKNLAEVAAWFRAHDDRPVHYEGIFADPRYPATSDVVSRMYAPVAEIEEYLAIHRDKPYILCEYAHAMGNSFGAVDKYTELAWHDEKFQGGFIWDFADQALPAVAPDGTTYWGYGGDFGDRPTDGDFSANGLCFADHTPKPLLLEAKQLYRPVDVTFGEGRFVVTNRMLFTPTSALACVAKLLRDGIAEAEVEVATDVAPLTTQEYPLPFEAPKDPGEWVAELSFRLREATTWASAGHEVCFAQHGLALNLSTITVPSAQRLIDGTHNVGVVAENARVLFSKAGGLVSWRLGERELLAGTPMPCFWHAPTSNERGWRAPYLDSVWYAASRYAVLSGPPRVEAAESIPFVLVHYDYDLPGGGTCELSYRIDGTAGIKVTLGVKTPEGWPDPPEYGVLVPLAGYLDRLAWYGGGPHESASDRKASARLGRWEQDVADQLTPYVRPQEAGGHAQVRWAEIRGDGVAVRFESDPWHLSESPYEKLPTPRTSAEPWEFSALPWTPFEVENAEHPWQLPPSNRTIVRASWKRRGVGGDDSWGAQTHPEFRLPNRQLGQWSFEMRAKEI